MDNEVTPKYRHQKKLADEQKQKKAPEVVSVSYQLIRCHTSSGKEKYKYREIKKMSNGNAYSHLISKQDYIKATKEKK